jgi:hypothetical protein
MGKFLETRVIDLAITTIVITALTSGSAWAGGLPQLPGPPAALLAGGAIVGTLVIVKWWKRK